jgi:hypothetical protein
MLIEQEERALRVGEKIVARMERKQAAMGKKEDARLDRIAKWEEDTGLKLPTPNADPVPIEKDVPGESSQDQAANGMGIV